MAVAVVLTKQLTAADQDAIAQAQALAAAGSLNLNGVAVVSGVAVLDSQRRVSILSSGNDSALTWAVTGKDGAGASISENVAGGNAVEVQTLQDFAQVSLVAADGAVAGTVQVGTNAIGSTRWWVGNYHFAPTEIALDIFIAAGAAVTASAEMTDDDPRSAMGIYRDGYSMAPPVPNPIGVTGMVGVVGTTLGGISGRPPAGVRLTVTAGTDAAQLTIRASGIKN